MFYEVLRGRENEEVVKEVSVAAENVRHFILNYLTVQRLTVLTRTAFLGETVN